MTGARDPADIEALLERVGLPGGPVRLTHLHGGYLNEVLLVERAAGRLVLKFFADPIEGTLFPNLPADEAEATRRLAPLDVAPALIGYWPQERVMASEFVEGGTWSDDMGAVAALLLRKEQADPEGFRTVPLTPEAILAEGDALFARVPELVPAGRPDPVELSPPARVSLIHTDIGAANLIGRGAGLRLIDWQCPAAGDLCEDIHSLLSPAFRILSECRPFGADDYASFFAALARPDTGARYHQLAPFYAWRMAGYCALRADTHPDPTIRARYRRAYAAELALIGT